mmetsp:Transcript_41879/g.100630  ORF Transcript_41879/g.100630 Transcript_41879/m.100630 type:complete len:286 (-) Transcript_41879:59-916(-)
MRFWAFACAAADFSQSLPSWMPAPPPELADSVDLATLRREGALPPSVENALLRGAQSAQVAAPAGALAHVEQQHLPHVGDSKWKVKLGCDWIIGTYESGTAGVSRHEKDVILNHFSDGAHTIGNITNNTGCLCTGVMEFEQFGTYLYHYKLETCSLLWKQVAFPHDTVNVWQKDGPCETAARCGTLDNKLASNAQVIKALQGEIGDLQETLKAQEDKIAELSDAGGSPAPAPAPAAASDAGFLLHRTEPVKAPAASVEAIADEMRRIERNQEEILAYMKRFAPAK